jgi:ubiquitin thioesterase protein OTUB1
MQELLEKLPTMTVETLTDELNQENSTSDYCTWFMRVVTATHLKRNADTFLPFLVAQGLDMQQFCARHVEPMGQECDQLQVTALAEAMQVQVNIEYLDGHSADVKCHSFGPTDAKLQVTMLYRPGHYDILYKRV